MFKTTVTFMICESGEEKLEKNLKLWNVTLKIYDNKVREQTNM